MIFALIILSIIVLCISIDDFHRRNDTLGTYELGLSFGIIVLVLFLGVFYH